MNDPSHTVTHRHTSRLVRGQSGVTTVTRPYRGVTVVTVTQAEKRETP